MYFMNKEEIEERIVQLVVKQLRNEISQAELKELEEYKNKSSLIKDFIERYSDENYVKSRIQRKGLIEQMTWDELQQKLGIESVSFQSEMNVNEEKKPGKYRILVKRFAIAASFIAVVSFGISYFILNRPTSKWVKAAKMETVDTLLYPPSGNKALLILASGEQLILDTANNGVIAEQGGSAVSKSGNELLYNANETSEKELFNVISTPNGSNYRLVLADGTKVILNASSKLKFPTSFNGRERKIELLEGQVFVDVVKDAKRPFVVIAKGTETKVLGTSFDINAYADNRSINTTLISGAIQVGFNKQLQVLKPGQQIALSDEGKLKTTEVDTYAVTAWLRDRFYFDNTPLPKVMDALAKWYGFKVEYKDDLGKELVSAVLARTSTANELFKDIEASCNVKITVNSHEVLIQKKI